MFQFQIAGFEQLTSLFEELGDAIKQLNGKLCEVRFDPTNPGEVQAAIDQTERTVDERLSKFRDNPMVQQLAADVKQRFKQEILKRASDARRLLTGNGTSSDLMNASALLGPTPVTPPEGWSLAQRRKGRTF
ncbi:MAG: hypothetical protein ACLQVM_03390 [Terriglobia bacterium]